MSFRSLIVGFCFLIFEPVFSKFACPINLSVNISNGHSNGTHIFTDDGLIYPPNLYFTEAGDTFGCICNITNCIRKCCPQDEVFFGHECIQTDLLGINFTVPVHREFEQTRFGNFHFVYNRDCNIDYYRLFPDIYEEDAFLIQENGSLFFPSSGDYINQHMFCVDNFLDIDENATSTIVFSAVVCFPEDQSPDIVYSFGTYPIQFTAS